MTRYSFIKSNCTPSVLFTQISDGLGITPVAIDFNNITHDLVISFNQSLDAGQQTTLNTIVVDHVPRSLTIYLEDDVVVMGDLIVQSGITGTSLSLIDNPVLNNNDSSQILVRNPSTGNIEYSNTIKNSNGVIGITIDAGDNVISSGDKNSVSIPYSGIINSWTILSNTSGNIMMDIYKSNYSSYPPTSINTITGNNKIIINSQNKNQSSNLSGWTTSFIPGDVFKFNVISATTINKVTLTLNVTKYN